MTKVKSNDVIPAVEPVSGNGKEVKPAHPSIDEIKKILDEQIAVFNRKSELIANREKFRMTRKELEQYLVEQGVDFDDTLDSANLRIQISDSRKYRADSQISIANNFIIREFIQLVINKIDAKIAEIELEILG
jgi:hypothetical protein